MSITWPDRAIAHQWLQVLVKANATTCLEADDVFYFANAIGETGDSDTDARVNELDEQRTRANPRAFFNSAGPDVRANRPADPLILITAPPGQNGNGLSAAVSETIGVLADSSAPTATSVSTSRNRRLLQAAWKPFVRQRSAGTLDHRTGRLQFNWLNEHADESAVF